MKEIVNIDFFDCEQRKRVEEEVYRRQLRWNHGFTQDEFRDVSKIDFKTGNPVF